MLKMIALFVGMSVAFNAYGSTPSHCPEPFVFKMITSLPKGWNAYSVTDVVRDAVVTSRCKDALVFDEPRYLKNCLDANRGEEKCRNLLEEQLKKHADKRMLTATVEEKSGQAPLNARIEVKIMDADLSVERVTQRFAPYTPGDLLAPMKLATRLVMHDPSLGCKNYAGGKCLVCMELANRTCPKVPQNHVPFSYQCNQNGAVVEMECIGMPQLVEPGSSIIARGMFDTGVSTWDSKVMGDPGSFAIKVEMFMKAQGQIVDRYESGLTNPGGSKFKISPFATLTPDVNGDVRVGLYAQSCWRNDNGYCDLFQAELAVVPYLRVCYKGPGVTDCDDKPPAAKVVKH